MNSYEIWDKKSSINGVQAENTGMLNYSDVYLIKDANDNVTQIQYTNEKGLQFYPYDGDTLKEKAKKHCQALNFHIAKQGYVDGTYTDEQLTEFVTDEYITQEQADEIKASKIEETT